MTPAGSSRQRGGSSQLSSTQLLGVLSGKEAQVSGGLGSLKNVSLQDLPAFMSNVRTLIAKDEAAQRAGLEVEFERLHVVIRDFERKMILREERCRKFMEVQCHRETKRIAHEMHQCVTEEEPSHRSNLVSLEQKCRAALVRIVLIERAVLVCGEQLIRIEGLERNRRTFLIAFEDRERNELEDAFGDTMAQFRVQPVGMQCLGRCPFTDASTHCPFRGKNRYRLQISRYHFTSPTRLHPDTPAAPSIADVIIPKRALQVSNHL
jgi:hypothetical protein